jgi:hypothetical protein
MASATTVVGAGVAVITLGSLGYYTLKDWLTHHSGDYAKTLAGIEVTVREQATNWNAHKIRITITWSPEDKVTGQSAEKHTWHARSSRENCFKELEQIVSKAYGGKKTN